MISKLPRWVLWGGSLLAFIAGMINAIGFMGLQHEAITHLTGTTTLIGISLAGVHRESLFHLLLVIGSFFFGAVLSGCIVKDSTLKLGMHYGLALCIETIALILAAILLHRSISLGDYLASFACGLQNAMASTYSGAVVRTSHVTGMVTDLGILLGHKMRRLPVDGRRVKLYLGIISGFLTGAIAGGLIFPILRYQTLFIPAFMTGMAALGVHFLNREAATRQSRTE